ncbi:MAG: hypothetical protein Fur0037_07960 [Planctomycetota bacterium]
MKRFWFRKRADRDAGSRPEGSGPGRADGSGLLSGDASEDQRSLEILLDTIAAVTANVDLDLVLAEIAKRSLMVTNAERAIVLLGTDPGDLAIRLAVDRDGRDLGGSVQYSRSLVGRCLERQEAVRSVVQSDQEALELGRSVYELRLRAVMCAPMTARNRRIGVIYVDSKAMRREFTDRDLALFSAISAQLAIGIENARLHADSLEKARLQKDVEIARRIQQHLLPTMPGTVPGLSVALRFEPAEMASGDTYDFVQLPGDRLAVMIGDVTGHGVGAALLTHAVQAALRSYLEMSDDVSVVVTRLNQRLAASVEAGNFMSLLIVVFDPHASAIRYVNAGHPGVIHVGEHGCVQHPRTGMVLGVVGDQVYEQSALIGVSEGDVLFLYTDGVDEARSAAGEVFGEDRLRRVLAGMRGKPAEEVIRAVEEALREHTGGLPPRDDLTMIALCCT